MFIKVLYYVVGHSRRGRRAARKKWQLLGIEYSYTPVEAKEMRDIQRKIIVPP